MKTRDTASSALKKIIKYNHYEIKNVDKLWFHAFWRLAKDAVHHHVILVLVTGAYKSFYFSFFLIFSLLRHFCFRGAGDQTDPLISARPTWPGRGALSWSHPQRCWPAPSSRLAPASLVPVRSGWSRGSAVLSRVTLPKTTSDKHSGDDKTKGRQDWCTLRRCLGVYYYLSQ